MQQADGTGCGSGAGRRWKAWGLSRQTGQNASRRLPHELGGVFWPPAEPSSDTPIVLLPGMWSGLPGQVLKPACLKLQAASALTSPHSSAGGGFSVPAGFSRDRWRRRNHLQLRRLVVCFQRHLQAHDPGPPSAPLAGDFLFQVADKPNRYQGRHHSPQPSNVGT